MAPVTPAVPRRTTTRRILAGVIFLSDVMKMSAIPLDDGREESGCAYRS
jgi:hypothetical protein